MQIRERLRAPGQGDPQRGGVRVLVHHHREAEPLREHLPQGIAVPPGEPGDPVQHAADMVEGAGQRHPHTEHDGRRVHSCPRCARHRATAPGRSPVDQPPHLPSDQIHHGRDPRREVHPHPPLGHHGPRQIHQDGDQRVPLQMHPHRAPRLRHEPQRRRGLPPGGGPPPRVGDEALAPEARDDLADGLRREPRPRRQLRTADALAPGAPQQFEHDRRVVPAQRPQIRPRRPGRTGVSPVHPSIVAVACTLATALPKWRS